MTGNGKPFLCRFGLHTSTYHDSAMFTSAERCNKCGEWVKALDGERVERERRAWTDMPDATAQDVMKSIFNKGNTRGE